MTPRLVALTGATGFVGRQILARLEGAGIRSRLLVRDPGKLPPTTELTDIVVGSLDDDDALVRLVAGASSLVHCAGAVRGVTRAQFDRVNAVAAGRCAAVARDAGVEHLLLISSLAAREPELSAYAASKRGGEEAVTGNAGSMSVTIFRPPAVYGPGDREMQPLFRLMARGFAPIFGSPDARFSLIFVEDLADAVLAWARDPDPGMFEIDDGHPGGYGWPEVCETVESITGKPVRQIPVPGALLGLPAAFNTLAGLATGYLPMLSLGKMRELRHPDWVCRGTGDSAPGGWRPRFRLAEGLRRTPGWQV